MAAPLEWMSDEDTNKAADDHVSSDEDRDYVAEMREEYSPANKLRVKYAILDQTDVQQRLEEVVSSITSMLSVSRSEAVVLLEHYNWSVSAVSEAWFADEERARESAGLVQSRPQEEEVQSPSSLPTEMTCGICFELHSLELMKSAVPTCGHFFCDTCWTSYIQTAIDDGVGCLTLRCAHPSCSAAIREDMVLSMVSEKHGANYTRYRHQAFIENKRTTKWCPAPGCEYAVEYGPCAGSSEIVCRCSHKFCWDCLEEAHRPVDCETVAKWILKNSSDYENTNWILANSKPCPKCKRPIERNQGCIHMTCAKPCSFEFCWLCLGDWNDHGRRGGNNTCNRFDDEGEIEVELEVGGLNVGAQDVDTSGEEMDVGDRVETQRIRELAQISLDRYTHHYERWAANESSKAKALSDFDHTRIEKLRNEVYETESGVEFVTKAWMQIVECRRILKWTYVYGYYLADGDRITRALFEYNQGEAEAHLDRLHECAEKELQEFLDGNTQKNFNDFRNRLGLLTTVTGTIFENLVKVLEK